MAGMLVEHKGRFTISSLAMRSLLDSLNLRLDETREISRYLIGLLVFLGLLGTFWGLLSTIEWYLNNQKFLKRISKKNYDKRLGLNL